MSSSGRNVGRSNKTIERISRPDSKKRTMKMGANEKKLMVAGVRGPKSSMLTAIMGVVNNSTSQSPNSSKNKDVPV